MRGSVLSRWSIPLSMLALLVVGCLTLRPRSASPTAPRPPALAPWHPGISLRATYETLPPGTESASLQLLPDNPAAWVARWRLLGAAQHSIDLTSFTVEDDVFGAALLGRLLERARAGVQIRLLVDGFGTDLARSLVGNDALDSLTAMDNVTVREYRPMWSRVLSGLLSLSPSVTFASNHDKILVIDGKHAIIGGRNVSRAYFVQVEGQPDTFRDIDVLIDDPRIAAAATHAFELQFESPQAHELTTELIDLRNFDTELLLAAEAMDRWLASGTLDAGLTTRLHEHDVTWDEQLAEVPELRSRLTRSTPPPIMAPTRIVDSDAGFGSADDPITIALGRFIAAARERIVIQSPYLVLSEEGIAQLAAAARRGVDIVILTNSPTSSDNALSQAFFLEQWPELLARVPTLRLYVAGQQSTVHGKTYVFDGRIALIGSYNLDPTSMQLNSEIMVAVRSEAFSRAVVRHSQTLIERGSPMAYEYRIRRDATGAARRDESGKVVIAFGPEDHCDPEAWTTLAAYWTTLRAAKTTGLSPIF